MSSPTRKWRPSVGFRNQEPPSIANYQASMTDTLATANYKLSYELAPPHSSDVKAVLAVGDHRLATASRDSSVGIWKHDTQVGIRFNMAHPVPTGDASRRSSCLCQLACIYTSRQQLQRRSVQSTKTRHSANHRPDLIASGGNSSMILLHSLTTLESDSIECLVGHSLNVCTLAYSSRHRKLISASWDGTARVWSRDGSKWETTLVLDGHDAAVWGVAIVDEGAKEGCYLTGE
jgi:WD40 repeat protein